MSSSDSQRPSSAEGFRNLTYETRKYQHSPNLVSFLLQHFHSGDPRPTVNGGRDFFNTTPQPKIIYNKDFYSKDIPQRFGLLYPGIACIKIQIIATKTDELLPKVFNQNDSGTAKVYKIEATARCIKRAGNTGSLGPGPLNVGLNSEFVCWDDRGNWDGLIWTDLMDIIRRVGAALYNRYGVRRNYALSESMLMSLRLKTPADGGLPLKPDVDFRAGISS